MVGRKLGSVVLGALAMALGGCTNDIVGEWEEVGSGCPSPGRFTVDDDLEASGTMNFDTGISSCERCRFTAEVTDSGSGRYDARIRFDVCACGTSRNADADCRMNDDGDRLDCVLDWGICGQAQADWRKRD